MGLRDRRRGSENVVAKIQPSGRAAMPQDPKMNNRNQTDHLSGSKADVYRGRVVHSLPQLGWHQVALDNGGIFPAEPTGHADKWGSQTIHVYQPGVQVLCAVNAQKNLCTILAQVPDVVGDVNDQYVMASNTGSQVGLETDPTSQVFLDAIKENDDTSAYEINPNSDQIAGDWGCRTNTGINVTVDSWMIDLMVDEVTGLNLDLMTQEFNLSGRHGVIETDGFQLSAIADNYSTHFGLGYFRFQDAFDREEVADLDAAVDEQKLKYKHCNFIRPYSLFVIGSAINLHASQLYESPWVAEIFTATQPVTSFDRGKSAAAGTTKYSVAEKLLQTGRMLTSMTSELLSVEPIMPGYMIGATEKEAHDKIVKRIHKFRADVVLKHSNLPIGPYTGVIWALADMRDAYTSVLERQPVDGVPPVPADYLLTDRFEVGLLYNPANDTYDLAEAHAAYLENETIQVSGEITNQKCAFVRKQLAKTTDGPLRRKDLRSIIHQDELTGDIVLVNEHGAGIRISGNSVFIEGGNVRIVSQKDVRILGRDVSISSNRNITLSSNKHTRVYAASNLNLLAGSSGRGGVLIENRGSNAENHLPDDAEDAVYAGVTIKSTRSPITALGGNIVLRAGDVTSGVSGSVLITSQGSALIASRDRVVLHSTAERLDTFGADYTKPTNSHMYGSNQVYFAGSLSAGQIWSQDSIVAKNNIQAVLGRVADPYGGLLGKVLAPPLLLGSLHLLSQTKTVSSNQWTSKLDDIKAEFQSPGKILNRMISSEMSGGYVKAEKAAKHYGSGSVSDTIPHLYRDALKIPTKPFKVHTVEYKPGVGGASKTYAFPGVSTHIACMKQSPLVIKIATADEWSADFIERVAEKFESVFATVQDLT